MQRLRKSVALILLMATIFSCSCAKRDGDSFSIMFLQMLDTKGSDYINAPAKQFITSLDEWEKQNPSIRVVKRAEYINIIANLAVQGKEHIPDLFVCKPYTGRLLKDNGMVADITEYVDDKTDCVFKPFTYDSRIYACPTLAMSATIIVYDPDIWSSAGFSEFPDTWEKLCDASERLKQNGYQTVIGLSDPGSLSVSRDLASIVVNDEVKSKWFDHFIDNDRVASFTDETGISILTELHNMLNSKVFNDQDKNNIENFINGKCPAIMIGGLDLYKLLERVKQQNPDLYKRMQFAALPYNNKTSVPCESMYGIYISANAINNPKKFAACIELCKRLSTANNEIYNIDETTERLHGFIKASDKCRICTNYSPIFNDAASKIASVDDPRKIRIIANDLQRNFDINSNFVQIS